MTSLRDLFGHYVLEPLAHGEQERQTWRYYDQPLYPSQGYPPMPEAGSGIVFGVDMSGYWNGVADWNVAKANGCQFAIIKAVDGTLKTANFEENVLRAQAAGLVVGAYFWLYRNARISGSAQARAWWDAVKNLHLDCYMVDMEWTKWNGQPDNPNTSDLYGAVIPFEQLAGVKPIIYSAPGYMSTYFNHDPMWAAYPFCIAHYGVLRPAAVVPWGNNWTFWQLTDRWPGLPLGLDPKVSTASDGDLFNGSQADFDAMFDQTMPPPIPDPVETDLGNGITHVQASTYDLIRYDPSRVELVLDDNPNDELPLVRVADWKPECQVVINGGRFVEYDAFGIPMGLCAYKGHTYCEEIQEQSIHFDMNGNPSWMKPLQVWSAINYPNKWITQGVARKDLDNATVDPRTMLGELAGQVYWFSTVPMTKQRACDLGAEWGLTELSNMDGGQSTSMRVNGEMVTGLNARAVATHMGIKPKAISGGTSMTTKGTVRAGLAANVKRMDGVLINGTSVAAQMRAGDSAYGDLSAGATDIINFTHFYRVDGSKFELPTLCKVNVVNLTVTPNATEPGSTPPPPASNVPHMHQTLIDDDGETWVFDADGVKQ